MGGLDNGTRTHADAAERQALLAHLRQAMAQVGADGAVPNAGEGRGKRKRGYGAARKSVAAAGTKPAVHATEPVAGQKEQVATEPADPSQEAFERVCVLCSHSLYSVEKMRQRLAREQVPADAAEAALARAAACGLIDDIRYGETLCAARLRAGKGRPGIEDELREHGIEPSDIEGWPEEYAERYGQEVDRALRLIDSHPPRSKRPRDSAYRRLLGKGYGVDTASRAAGLWWERQQDASEER